MYIMNLFYAYLKLISDIYKGYLSYIKGTISQVYNRYISGRSWVYLKYISDISQTYLRCISSLFLGISQEYIRNFPGIYKAIFRPFSH